MRKIELWQGDCLELMKNIPDKSVDMILCDLPYGTTNNKFDKRIPIEPLWQHYNRIIKDNGAIVLFSQMPFGAELIMSNKKMFRYEWIWQKTRGQNFLNANKMPLRAHENILIFYKKLPTYNPQFTKGKAYTRINNERNNTINYGKKKNIPTVSNGNKYPLDVLKFSNVCGKHLHPHRKPVALLEYLIKTYTNESELVLDNCCGSGSTGVACVNTNRNFIGIELDENYFNIAKERIEKAKGGAE